MDLIPVLDPHSRKIMEQFISSRFDEAGAEKAVIGVSGGLDSSLALDIVEKVLGISKTVAYFLPFGDLSDKDRGFAKEAADSCGVQLIEHNITPIVNTLPTGSNEMVKGNAAARARMVFLYTMANKVNGLVIGTSNKSELLMGYFTKYGDGAADLYPMGDLFKTQVRELAISGRVPETIIERPPSASLMKGQTDEGEMGIPYSILDQVLNGTTRGLKTSRIRELIDTSVMTEDEIERSGLKAPIDDDLILRIISTVRRTRHKRMSLAIPKIGTATIGVDLRERW